MSESKTSKLPIWLIASLLVNALLIGLLIGGGLGQRKGGGPPSSMPGDEQALIRGIDRALPEDERQMVREAFRQGFADSRQERLRVQAARANLGRLMSADPYDEAAVRAAFGELRAADAVMKARLQDVLTEQFGALSAEQRQTIIESLSRPRMRDRGQGGERPRPGPRPFQDRD